MGLEKNQTHYFISTHFLQKTMTKIKYSKLSLYQAHHLSRKFNRGLLDMLASITESWYDEISSVFVNILRGQLKLGLS